MAWSDSLTKNTKLATAKKEDKKKVIEENTKSEKSQSAAKMEKAAAWDKSVTKRTDSVSNSGKGYTKNESASSRRVFTPTPMLGKGTPSQRITDLSTAGQRRRFVPSTVRKKETVMTAPTEIHSGANATIEKKPGFGKWVIDNVMNGVGQFNRGVINTLDFVLPTAKDFGGYSAADKFFDYMRGTEDELANNASKTNKIKGKNWETAGDVASMTVAAVPNAILAMMSGGTSAGASALEGTATTGIGQTLLASSKQLAKNPMFWTSFAQTAGNTYDEAKAEGANDIEATATAMISSLINAGVEVSGGIETMPKNTRGISAWIRGMFDEGKEEVIQGVIEQSTKKAIYDHNRKLVSNSDEKSVINPKRAAQEFGGGAIVGGILGAAQMGAGAAADAYNNTVNTGHEVKNLGATQDVIYTGLHSKDTTSAYKYADRLQQKQNGGQDLSDWNVGRQFQKNIKAIDAENSLVNNLANVTGAQAEIHADMEGLNGQYASNNGSQRVDISANGNLSVPDIAKHEFTHLFEQNAPEAYAKFKDYILQAAYDTNTDAVNSRLNALRSEYEKRGLPYTEQLLQNEIAAELTESFLKNPDNIEKIANGNKSLADKILDGIRTAKAEVQTKLSSPYKNNNGIQLTYSQLNQAEQLWNNTLRQAAENRGQTSDGESVTRYSPNEYDKNGNKYWRVDTQKDIFKNIKRTSELKKTAYNYILSGADGMQVSETIDGQTIVFNRVGAQEYVYGRQSQELDSKYGERVKRQKMRLAPSIDDLIENASVSWTSPDSKNHKQFDGYFDNYRGRVSIDDAMFNYIVRVGYGKSGDKLFYDLNLEPIQAEDVGSRGLRENSIPHKNTPTSSTDNVPQNEPIVKNSLKENAETDNGIQPSLEAVKTADRIARDYTDKYNSETDTKELSRNILQLHGILSRGINNENNLTKAWETAADIGLEIARGSQYANDEMTSTYKELSNYLRKTPIKYYDDWKSETDSFDNYNELRKSKFGSLNLSKNGVGIDGVYKELSTMFPNFFNEETESTPAAQLERIIEVQDSLKPEVRRLEGDALYEAADSIAAELINDVMGNKKNLGKITSSAMERFLSELREKGVDADLIKKFKAAHNADVRTDYIRQRNEAADRKKLLNLSRELGRMKLSPENQAKIPEILKDIDTMGISILENGYTRKDGAKVDGKLELSKLRDEYYKIKESDPDFIPDSRVEQKILRLDKMQIQDMEIGDVRELINTLQQVKHEIRTNNKMLRDNKNREIADVAWQSMREINASKGSNYLRSTDRFLDGYNTMQLSAVREFRRLSGYAKDGAFAGLANDLNNGQRKSLAFQKQISDKFSELAADKKEMQRLMGNKAEMINITGIDKDGKKITLPITPAMRISLYLHSKNNANLRHITYGGVTIPDATLYKKGKFDEAYSRGKIIKLTRSQINDITSGMSDFEKRFADAAHEVFNDDFKQAINKTSLELLGYEKATVGDYFPIATDRHFTNSEFEGLIRDKTLEGSGMLKERQNASNPILLEDVTSVISRQSKNVGDYYGLAVPIRNFDRVYKSTGKGYGVSMSDTIARKWGKNSEKYIENLITDLQGGRSSEYGFFDKLKGNFAQATLAFNPGVMLKQLASYPTAAAVLGYEPLAKGLATKVTQADIENCYKYTPLLWYRSQGYTTSEIGDYANGNSEDWTKSVPGLMGWIQKFDMATTTKLWKAAEYHTEQNSPELKKGSDAFYKKTAETYNRVIEETQPNYTVMQRPDILRSDNKAVGMVTMFKTQIMQNYNILYDAFGEYNARLADYKSNSTAETKADLKAAKTNLSKAISSQIIQAAMIAGINALTAGALKGTFKKKYGDDDENLSFGSVAKGIGTDMLNNLIGTALGGSEAASLVEAFMGKGKWYDMEAPMLTTINDLANAIMAFSKLDIKGVSDARQLIEPTKNLAQAVGTATGIPIKNAMQYLSGITGNVIKCLDDTGKVAPGLIDNYKLQYAKTKFLTELNADNANKFYPTLRGAKQNLDNLTEAADETDKGKKRLKRAQDTYNYIYNDMLDSGIEEDKLKNAVKGKKEKAAESDFGRNVFKPRALGQIDKSRDIQTSEIERLAEWSDSVSIDKESGKTYIKYGRDTYELTDSQAKDYISKCETRITEYQSALSSGGNIEDVMGALELNLYADEMTQEQYNEMLAKAETNVNKNYKKEESRQSAIKSRDDFVNGYSTRKVTVSGSYNNLSDSVKKKVMDKAKSKAIEEIRTEMEEEIKKNNVYYTEPSHARNKENNSEQGKASSGGSNGEKSKSTNVSKSSGSSGSKRSASSTVRFSSGNSNYSNSSSYTPAAAAAAKTTPKFRATDMSAAPKTVAYGNNRYSLNSAQKSRYANLFSGLFNKYSEKLSTGKYEIANLIKDYEKGIYYEDLSNSEKEKVMSAIRELAATDTEKEMREDIEKNGTARFTPETA